MEAVVDSAGGCCAVGVVGGLWGVGKVGYTSGANHKTLPVLVIVKFSINGWKVTK